MRHPHYVEIVTKTYREAIEAHYNGTFSKKKIGRWVTELKKVYNRGFSPGFYFKRMTDLFNGPPKKMLHVAPEQTFEKLLQSHLGQGYLTADLHKSGVMVRMDITDIDYTGGTFDVIYCSHVLEHVPDDKRAIRELHRVLKPNGWAILQVPITADITFEDPSITDPTDRLRLFGNKDHVRSYGPDFVERLQEAGFKVKIITASDFLTEEQTELMGITEAAGEIYYCTKQ